MHSRVFLPGEIEQSTRFHFGRYVVIGLVLLCVAGVGYSGIDLVKDVWLVNEAFPSLPSGFANELDAALVFSPLMLHMDSGENSFLRFIKYPPLTLPDAQRPARNPIGDEIRRAQSSQGTVAVDDIMSLKESSLDAMGRAVFLSQDGSDAAQAFAKGGEHSLPYPGFAQATAVKQLRQLFEIAYGQRALEQVTRPEKIKVSHPAPIAMLSPE